MDSSSSGSMHSSGGGGGGGDEEFGDSFSAFLSSSRTSDHAEISSIQQPPPITPIRHQNHPSSLFDPTLSTSFDFFTQSTPPPASNSGLDLDMVLSRGFTSAPSCSSTGPLMGHSSSSAQQVVPGRIPFPNPSSMQPASSGHENSPRASAPSDPSNVAVRNPKKRSRASRRAPTTVLTTDTSNFRAMVQEFTGIPPPPFSASPFAGNRLNLFSNSSTMRPGLELPLPYPLRPFAHKGLPPSFMNSSMVAPTASITNNIAGTTANSTTSTISTIKPTSNTRSNTYNQTSIDNYQIPSELGFPRQSQNLLNMQNPLLTFQSQLQPSHKYPLPNVPLYGVKSQTSATLDSVLQEFNESHGQLNTDHLGTATKSLDDEWIVIEEQHK